MKFGYDAVQIYIPFSFAYGICSREKNSNKRKCWAREKRQNAGI